MDKQSVLLVCNIQSDSKVSIHFIIKDIFFIICNVTESYVTVDHTFNTFQFDHLGCLDVTPSSALQTEKLSQAEIV